jgi:hypothetical protein
LTERVNRDDGPFGEYLSAGNHLIQLIFIGKTGKQLVIGALQVFRHHPEIGDNRHEIGVAVPSGDDMYMKMLVNACPRSLAEVDADVETLRRSGVLEDVATSTQGREQVEHLFGGEFVEVCGMTEWGNHEMAVIVRISVEHYERQRGPAENEALPVLISFSVRDAENAAGGFLVDDIINTPWRPDSFHIPVHPFKEFPQMRAIGHYLQNARIISLLKHH